MSVHIRRLLLSSLFSSNRSIISRISIPVFSSNRSIISRISIPVRSSVRLFSQVKSTAPRDLVWEGGKIVDFKGQTENTIDLLELKMLVDKNKLWYWKHREELFAKYYKKFVVIDKEGHVVRDFDDYYAAISFGTNHCSRAYFWTRVGMEFWKPGPPLTTSEREPTEPLVSQYDEPPVYWLHPIEEAKYRPTAFVHGENRRLFVTLPVKVKKTDPKVVPVVFLLDTGGPNSFLCQFTAQALSGPRLDGYTDFYPVTVFGKEMRFGFAPLLHKHINLLGMDMLWHEDWLFETTLKFPHTIKFTHSTNQKEPVFIKDANKHFQKFPGYKSISQNSDERHQPKFPIPKL